MKYLKKVFIKMAQEIICNGIIANYLQLVIINTKKPCAHVVQIINEELVQNYMQIAVQICDVYFACIMYRR